MNPRLLLILPLLFPVISILSEELPTELDVLVTAYERETRRVMEPIERKYTDALYQLKERYTKAGRLADALVVDELIKKRSGLEVVKDTRWKWGGGGELTLKADGVAAHTRWTQPGSWKKLKNGNISLLSHSKVSHIIEFLDDGTGVVTAAGGSTTITPLK